MARGLLEIVEERTPYHTIRKWKSNPIRALTDSWVLVSEQARPGLLFLALLHPRAGTFLRALQSARRIARSSSPPARPVVDPAGRGCPAGGHHRRTYGGRGGARPVPGLCLPVGPRIGQGPQGRGPPTPVLRAMEKAVPLDTGADLRLPDPHGFFFELLRQAGAVRIQGDEAIGRSRGDDAADRPVQPLAGAPTRRRGWLSTRDWFDGYGMPDGKRTRALRGERMQRDGRSWPGRWAAWPAPAIIGTT